MGEMRRRWSRDSGVESGWYAGGDGTAAGDLRQRDVIEYFLALRARCAPSQEGGGCTGVIKAACAERG